MKDAYWARFFQKSESRYYADLPDLPGCATEGPSVEEVYHRLVNEAIPLWLEDQPWPSARGADQILTAPGPQWSPASPGSVAAEPGRKGRALSGSPPGALEAPRPLMLMRITINEVGGSAVGTWTARSVDADYARRRQLNH